MPKNRGDNTIATRTVDDENYDEREMSDRLQRRLRTMGAISVEIESRSRHRRENVQVLFDHDLNHATVTTEGGGYRVNTTENTCTCPDYVHRQGRCRHLEAVDIAREQTRQGIIAGSQDDTGIISSQTLAERQRSEVAEEVNLAARIYTDDDFFYSEHPTIFDSDMARFASEPVPYYYENVLNGSDITFGIELEFVDGDSDAIAAELHDMGICGNASMSGYHGSRVPGMWTLESDSSVTRRGRGGELISPILTDTPDTWRTIEKVCEVAKRHGAHVNTATGAHVHVGAADALDGKKQRWRRFFKMGVGFEHTYRRISGGEQGVFRGGTYAVSSEAENRRGIRMHLSSEDDTSGTFTRIARSIGRKYRMINLSPLQGKNTVEFRGFNGTLTPGIIQANVKFAAGFVNSAERSKKTDTESMRSTDSDKKRAQIIDEYEENNAKTNTAIMRTLDAVFSRKEDKQHLLSVIAKNRWY